MSARYTHDLAHRRATAAAAGEPCLLCRRCGSVPAHWPTHRGMGAGKAGWDRTEWVPLCPTCHDLVDGRLGRWQERTCARRRLAELAPRWWAIAPSRLDA